MDYTFDIDKALDDFERGEDLSGEINSQEKFSGGFTDVSENRLGHQEQSGLPNYRLTSEVPKNVLHSEYQIWDVDSNCRWAEQSPIQDQTKNNYTFSSEVKSISQNSLNQSTHSLCSDVEVSRISQKLLGDVSSESLPPSQRNSLLQNSQAPDCLRNLQSTSLIHSVDEYETNGYHINDEEEFLSVSFDDTSSKDSTVTGLSDANIQIQLFPPSSLSVNTVNCNPPVGEGTNTSSDVEKKSKSSLQSISDCLIHKPLLYSNACNENIGKVHSEQISCEGDILRDLVMHSEFSEQGKKEDELPCQRISDDSHTADFSQNSLSNQSSKCRKSESLKSDLLHGELVSLHCEKTLGKQVLAHSDNIINVSESKGHARTTKSVIHESSDYIISDEKNNEDQGVSCSPDQGEVPSFVSFSDVDPETNESDFREMEEYLSNVDMNDVMKDKDSGISFSHGDINSTGVTSFNGDVYDKKVSEKVRINDSTLALGDLKDYNKVVPEEKQVTDYGSDLQSRQTVHNNTLEQNVTNIKEVQEAFPTPSIEINENPSIISNFFENVKEINRGARPKTKDHNVNITSSNQEPHLKDQLNDDLSQGSSLVFSNPSHVLSLSKLSHDFVVSPCQSSPEDKSDYEEITFQENNCNDKNYSSELDSTQNAEDLAYENEEQSLDDVEFLHPINASHKNPRIPRPTTLDLPARVTVKPKTSPTDLGIEDSSTPESEDHRNCPQDSEDCSGSSNVELSDANSDKTLSELDHELGKKKPVWIPDADASACMHCGVKFTVIKRRHHCRACGKVLCSQCCRQKAKLAYLDNKERVCQQCLVILSRVQDMEKLQPAVTSSSVVLSPDQGTTSSTVIGQHSGTNHWRPNPNKPEDYVSTIPPLQQVQNNLNCPPPTVMVPGVLRKGDKPRGEPKTVIFADGIRPGGDLTDPEPSGLPSFLLKPMRGFRANKHAFGDSGNSQQLLGNSVDSTEGCKTKPSHPRHTYKRIVINDSEGPLHPILLPLDFDVSDKPNFEKLINWLEDEQKGPVIFAVTKNLHILTKILKLDCCIGHECWCFTSRGLNTVGQDEVMVILQRLPNETIFPRDVFLLFSTLYDNASRGSPVGELGHTLFPDGIFGSREHSGFLFVRPTFQCLSKLTLPSQPYLVALLIQMWEVPWAKVFPLRLMLRLGAEFRYYPCPLVSVRFRRPVFGEVGSTIMKFFADFRNYQFTLQFIPGIVIHMEERKTCVLFPKNRYEKVTSILSNECVLAFGSNFSTEADSHLVCMQNENDDYQTQAINIQNTPRKVTGASFIAFCGALKTTTGLTAKSSIVEDGVLVQIPADIMETMKNSLRKMKNFSIGCGRIGSPPEEEVMLIWTDDDKKFNIGVKSPIDNKSLEGVQSVRIYTGTDYAGENYLIRWTEVFFIQIGDSGNGKCSEPADPTRLAKALAAACCPALIQFLDQLVEAEFTKIGLRATLDSERDRVGYEIGSRGDVLPSVYMNALDSALIPVISCVSASNQEGPVVLELIFHIILK